MNKNDFLSLIGSNKPIDRQLLSEISELVNIYPYFQTAHLLLLKGLKENSDIRFENQLRNSAIHIGDREVLFRLLNMTPGQIGDEKISEMEEIEEKPEVRKEESEGDNTSGRIPESAIIPESEVQNVDALVDTDSERVIQAEKNITDTTSETDSLTVQTDVTVSNTESQTDEMRPEEALSETVMAEIPVEEIPQVEELKPPEPAEFMNVTGDLEQTVIESGRNSEDLIQEIEKSSGEKACEDSAETPEHIPGRTILLSVESDTDESSERNVLVLDEEADEEEEGVFYMDPGFSMPETEESEPSVIPQTNEDLRLSKRQEQADLIDKFILANPRIEPKKDKSEVAVEDLAQKFTEERGSFVTETLARIYVNQGYYSRAIDIYEKLSLKFPEKSGYFAAQIEKIKELIK